MVFRCIFLCWCITLSTIRYDTNTVQYLAENSGLWGLGLGNGLAPGAPRAPSLKTNNTSLCSFHVMALTALNLLFLVTFVSLLPLQVSAFGAGDIPEFSYLNSSSLLFILQLILERRHPIDRAFRHGDIENILSEIAKTAAGGGILQFAHSVLASGSGGSKFSKADIKKVYFVRCLLIAPPTTMMTRLMFTVRRATG